MDHFFSAQPCLRKESTNHVESGGNERNEFAPVCGLCIEPPNLHGILSDLFQLTLLEPSAAWIANPSALTESCSKSYVPLQLS